jgi:hypothetical protein
MLRCFALDMKFKRPSWLALLMSLGLFVLGCAAFLFVRPDSDEFSLKMCIMEGGLILMLFSVIGFFASLVWLVIDDDRKR